VGVGEGLEFVPIAGVSFFLKPDMSANQVCCTVDCVIQASMDRELKAATDIRCQIGERGRDLREEHSPSSDMQLMY